MHRELGNSMIEEQTVIARRAATEQSRRDRFAALAMTRLWDPALRAGWVRAGRCGPWRRLAPSAEVEDEALLDDRGRRRGRPAVAPAREKEKKACRRLCTG